MQFVRNGPDIPERLLQAHEDGRVVFFCGAGVSYPASLPGFENLVTRIFEAVGETPNAVQRAAIKLNQFDTAIGLLEAGIIDGRRIVRHALVDVLTPNFSAPGAVATHRALLTLGKCRSGHTRLITTNFDRLFEEVIKQDDLAVKNYHAPLLPVPKNRWDGLVYLHGLLPVAPKDSDLDHLVLSSGDFGLAYLTERWAARFVTDLFRNYTVCFVGYSIQDPVLRYMMDALAADRLLGESTPEMFAFGSYSKGKEDDRANEWVAKNVTPILYRERSHHSYLHKTLREWAETYRDGVRGKERIVVECAVARPLASTRQDDFVGRLLWALSDMGGLPAKRFADIDPVPSLDWLEPLSEGRYRHIDLVRFGVPPAQVVNGKLTFSLSCRPSPYDRAPWMALANAGTTSCRWDNVMSNLGRWLTRHLDDPALGLWVAKRGGRLHDEFAWLIERRLDELASLRREGKDDELQRIRSNAPNAVPGPLMCTLWRVILTGRLKSQTNGFDLYRWLDRFNRDGLTTTLRLELRETLAPCVSLRTPFHWSGDQGGAAEPQRLKDIVEWEIVLATDHVHSTLHDLLKKPRWIEVLPDLLSEFASILRDTLDLMRELGGAEDQSDLSYMHQPSISEHPQNRDFHDWTALIDLTRDAWIATAAREPEQARYAAEGWLRIPYPLFRRLAFFAAAQEDVISSRSALDWLLTDDCWWLWSIETEREAMRLLVALAPKLEPLDLGKLERAVLAGPPRAMFKDDIEAERWASIVGREVWLRLAKITAEGAVLSSVAEAKLTELSKHYPQWQLASDERDEFPFWMGGGEDWRKFLAAPREPMELIEWLKQHPSTDHWQEDNWRQLCREDFGTTADALLALAKDNQWPIQRWREALQAWSDEKLVNQAWDSLAPVLAEAPDDVVCELDHGVSSWLQALSKTFERHEELFFKLCRRILTIDGDRDGVDTDDAVMRAINHPVGHVTDALLRWWYRSSPEDGQRLPGKIAPIFTDLCDTSVDKFRHARVLLAAHVIALFRVDRDWATTYLLPLFDWQASESIAVTAWEGFLWSARLYRPLMEVIKGPFLDTASHYAVIGEHAEQYAALLTFAALDPGDTFTRAELSRATHLLPQDGLRSAAETLVRALEGSGEQRVDYWVNRVVPYLKWIWPKARELISPTISENLGRLCLAAEEAFPDALEILRPWLQQPHDSSSLVYLLKGSEICHQFPEAALDFLDIVTGGQTLWSVDDLEICLKSIRKVNLELAADPRFGRLVSYLRQHGKEWD